MPKINRNGVNIHYETYGEGPVVLLTHGFSATSKMWYGQIES
ncbi:MAG TPA: alpha/beta hydrolase, partial [Gammaproteobacteria bacterium]|nr:alpha/beta hydrolase [Gammaproteobacteria bacterium]